MKINLIAVCCLLLVNVSFGQGDAKKYKDFWNKGDSFYEAKDYKKSAFAYSSALKMSATDISLWEHWITARSWAKANYLDSAFYHLNFISNSKKLTLDDFDDDILSDESFTLLHTDKRWPNFKEKMIANYVNLALTIAERIRSGHWTNNTNNRYDAACVWALANEPDSAFNCLDKIVNSNYNMFIDYDRISNDKNLFSLHTDKRWQLLMNVVKESWKPGLVRHTFTGPSIPFIATIDSASSFLKSDGLGSYRNGVDKVSSREQHGYSLEISGHKVLYNSGNRNDLSSRYIILDLNSPINGSGSVAQGIIKDNDLEFHVLYKFDTTVIPKLVYNFREIPVGATIESDRTEIDFYINGVLYSLTMGPWALGDNNEALAHKGHLSGKGTTKVQVTRHSETSYTIVAKDESIGRLWKTQNMTNPVDMGLFKTGFIVHLQKQ